MLTNENVKNISEKEKDLIRNLLAFSSMIDNTSPDLAMDFLKNYCEVNKFSLPKEVLEKKPIENIFTSSLIKWSKKSLELDVLRLKNTFLKENLNPKVIESLVNLLALKWELNEEIFWRIKNMAETNNDKEQLERAVQAKAEKILKELKFQLTEKIKK
jgi:hypothetical protein